MPKGDRENSEIQMDNAADPCRHALSQPVALPPDTRYNHSGGSAAVISPALRKAIGKPFNVLTREVLFEKLGICDVIWARYDASDDPMAASGLQLRPGDLLKIGQPGLNRRAWNGQPIVAAAWIEQSTAPISRARNYFYSFQWWLGRSLVAGQEVDWVAGSGLGGQRLFIIPPLDAVVLVHAGLYDSDMQGWILLRIINRYALVATAAWSSP